jgi:hypothetical protein
MAAGFTLPLAASATPVMDGERDAEYTLVASSPKDNLLVDPSAVPPIDDPADPRAKDLDVANIYAANTGADLYLYIELPYLDLNTIAGEWAVVFHLGGANDAIERVGTPNDPYGAAVDYGHVPACNAVLKSNMCGFGNDYDGNQGYAFLNPVNNDANDWDWENGNFLGNAWVRDTANNLIHGTGTSGGEIVYKGLKGIEVKIPLGLFAPNSANTKVTAPKPGDTIKMQFYDNIRERTGTKYPRGAIDCVPFEADSRTDPTRSFVTQYGTYTMAVPVDLEVTGLHLTSITDTEHAVVNFSASVGAGAATASNYAVVNEATGTAIPVSSAVVESADDTKVDIALALPFSTKIKVTVTNVKGASGSDISATKNTAELSVGSGIQYNLYDPWGAVAQLGNDPATTQPYVLTLTGDFIGWANTATGAGEIVMSPVAGEPGHLRSPAMIVAPGLVGYKYRIPTVVDKGNYDAWNAVNPYDRRVVVRASSALVQINDNAAGPYDGVTKCGPTAAMTFTLVDLDNKVSGKDVYLTGVFNGWTTDPLAAPPAVKLAPVAGKPNTYSGTFTPPANYGNDITFNYKYLIIDPATSTVDWDTLNPNSEWSHDHWAIVHGVGSPATQTVEDIVGSKGARISRIASGLNQAPGLAGYWREIDMDVDGYITLVDAIKAVHP